MINESENNRVYFSDLFPQVAPKTFKGVSEVFDRYGVPYKLLSGTKDIWVRDFMPLQSWYSRKVLFGYHPDYLRNSRKYRPTISNNMAVCEQNWLTPVCDNRGILVDGGNVVHGYCQVVMTAKVFEENPQIPPRDLIHLLETHLEARVIFLPWDTAEPFGHTDGILRIIDDETVLMTNYAQIDPKMAARFRNCMKPHFKHIVELKYDVQKPSKNNWAYINWLQTDKVLILPKFNIPEDEQAFAQISEAMPAYKGRIEMVDATDLICHEGCLNCASWTCCEKEDTECDGI